MPIPSTPVTREEQFLDGIANNSTSNLPTPVTREEMYLDAIARNGGGGGGGSDLLVIYASVYVDSETGDSYVDADKTTDEAFAAVMSDLPIMLNVTHWEYQDMMARGYIACMTETEIMWKVVFLESSYSHPYIISANSNGDWECADYPT